MSTIFCKGIAKSFGKTQILQELDLEVPEGSVVTLLGASGSGKTTLLRMIAGFERPDTGTILIGDQVVDSTNHFVPPEKRRIGYVAQEGNLFPHLTVAKNIAFGLSRQERNSGRVEELLNLVGLDGLGKRYPHQLSGGQQQRVALARALATNPQVVLLDEPFSSLDARLRSSLRFDVMRILREQRATTVFVTHDQEEALSVADLVGIMNGGRIRQFATPEALYTRPVDPAVAQFLGEANILAGTVSQGVVDTALGKLSLANTNGSLEGQAVALIRPEQISLRLLAEAHRDPDLAVGQVAHRAYYGYDCIMLVDISDGEYSLRVRCPGCTPIQVGDTVALSATGEIVAWPASRHGEVSSLRRKAS
jgi:iron(III) transport system ATP-binding protein